jgi:hypothetical protein
MRYRKLRMQRIAIAAFQQGVFLHADVGQRVNAPGREAPIVQDRVERPQLYEVWQHDDVVSPAPSTHVTRISRLPGHWAEYQVRSLTNLCTTRFLTILLAHIC